jgi:two-component system, NtrC family, sensor kinase
MRLSTRLFLYLSASILLVTLASALVTLQLRERSLREAHGRETRAMAEVLQLVAGDARRDGRDADLERVLMRRLADPQATLVESEMAVTRTRHALVALMLFVAAALVMHQVLERTLTRRLREFVAATDALAREPAAAGVRVPDDVAELAELAGAFNRMAGRLEARLRDDYQALLHEQEEKHALQRMLAEEERYAVLGRLSGGLAHELGTPLNVIRIRAEAVAVAATPALAQHAHGIVAEVQRITSLVRGLMQVARRHELELRPLELGELMRGAAAEIRPEARAAGVEIAVDTPARPVVVLGDAVLLRHAVLNLAFNALHAMRSTPERRLLRLAVRADAGTGAAALEVEDTGHGIDESIRGRVFEPFFTTKDVDEGSGLGLAIARGIVEQQGGSLGLEPREGGGTRVCIRLPAAVPEVAR